MPGFSLELDKVRISCQEMKLKLFVESTASFSCSDESFGTKKRPELLDLFTSGKVWASRGNNLRLDFQILFDDRPCPQNVSEILGNHIRHAHLWSQVSMEPKLEFSTSKNSKVSFSIKLNHAFLENTPSGPNNTSSSVPADVQAPEKINSVQLERVDIRMKFKSYKVSDVNRNIQNEVPSEPMLHGDEQWDETLDLLENIQDRSSHQLLRQVSQNLSKSISFSSRRNSGSLISVDEEMLDDETILFRSNITTPSLASQPSTQSSSAWSLSQGSYNRFVEDMTVDSPTTLPSFDFGCACKMADFALRTLIGGRQIKSQQGIKFFKPYPIHSLSEIVPSLWSPGFLQAISQRSQFISTISHSLSTSLLHNVQSPSLRRKLLELELRQCQSRQDYHSDDYLDRDAANISHNIDQAMRARIWAMMQRCLYDPLAARRLQPFNQNANGCQRGGDDITGASKTHGDLEIFMDKQQPSKNKLVDSVKSILDGFEDIFNGNANNEKTRDFEDIMSDNLGTEDDGVFDDLFNDNASGTRSNSFEALSDGVLNDISDNEVDALGMEAFGPLNGNGTLEIMGYSQPNAQRIPPPDNRGEFYPAGVAGIDNDSESMLV